MYFSPSNVALIDTPIWEDCIEVSDETHNTLVEQMKLGKLLGVSDDGQPILIDPPVEVEPTLEERKVTLVQRLNNEYEYSVGALRQNYPPSETDTWTVQNNEAKAYQKWMDDGRVGDPPETTFLTDLTNSRTMFGVGDGLEDLVIRVLYNSGMYSPALAHMTAVRHAAEKQILAVEAIDELPLIQWDFGLPALP